nr:FAD binding domain-containing protein [uncultured Anaeromusa sp.]
MLTFQKLAQPQSLAEAYEILTAQKNNFLLGGGAFLRLSSAQRGTAVDLSACNLSYIEETEAEVCVGAMATLRDLELSPSLLQLGCGVASQAVSHIIGVQFRHSVTVGGSVFGRFGFSDLLPTLLVLEASVHLYKDGVVPLVQFMEQPPQKDILTQVVIPRQACRASYQQMRTSCSDFPLLNVAVAESDGVWKIAVGARPGWCPAGACGVGDSSSVLPE